jgi:hypothetical protein
MTWKHPTHCAALDKREDWPANRGLNPYLREIYPGHKLSSLKTADLAAAAVQFLNFGCDGEHRVVLPLEGRSLPKRFKASG